MGGTKERKERKVCCYDILRYVTIGDPRESAELFLVGSRQNSTTNDNDDGSDDWDGRECRQKWLGWWPTSWGCRMWTRMWQARIKMRRSYVFLNTKLAPKMKAIQCQKLSKRIPQPLKTCWIGSSNAHVQARIEPPLHNRKKLLLCQGKCAEAGKTQIAALTFHICNDSRYRTRLSTPTCCASICIYLYQHLSTST